MACILIAYATTEGHTRKITKQVSTWLQELGHQPTLVDTSDLPLDLDVSKYDAFILAGSIHVAKHQKELVLFAKRFLEVLNERPTAFMSVSASASRRDEKSMAAVKKCTDDFCKETKLNPTATITVGGAILYTKYNFLIRAVMKRISASEGGPTDTSRDHELTDWARLRDDVAKFVTATFPAATSSTVINC